MGPNVSNKERLQGVRVFPRREGVPVRCLDPRWICLSRIDKELLLEGKGADRFVPSHRLRRPSRALGGGGSLHLRPQVLAPPCSRLCLLLLHWGTGSLRPAAPPSVLPPHRRPSPRPSRSLPGAQAHSVPSPFPPLPPPPTGLAGVACASAPADQVHTGCAPHCVRAPALLLCEVPSGRSTM